MQIDGLSKVIDARHEGRVDQRAVGRTDQSFEMIMEGVCGAGAVRLSEFGGGRRFLRGITLGNNGIVQFRRVDALQPNLDLVLRCDDLPLLLAVFHVRANERLDSFRFGSWR